MENDMKRKLAYVFLILSLTVASSAWSAPVPGSGQTTCYDDVGNVITCPSKGQNFYGQDANNIIHPPSYAKLDSNGNSLPDSAASWSMVKDNVTGLVWEVKTNKDGVQNYADPHDADNTYTWYDSNPATNGGNAGTPGDGADTETFIKALNDAKFGGFSDWRMPADKELAYITDYSVPYPGPTIDTKYFPNTIAASYWSSDTLTNYTDNAWLVHFDHSYVHAYYKSNANYVMAVRGGPSASSSISAVGSSPTSSALAAASFTDNGDGSVTDNTTGLIWQQTAASNMTWAQALSYCAALNVGGHTDWRLPSVKELRSLADNSRINPAIDTTYFPNAPASWYWSGTTGAYQTSHAWIVNFYFGDVDDYTKTNTYCVRAVRGGETQIGVDSGSIQISLPANQIVNLMVNSTNGYGDTPVYEWLPFTEIVSGVSQPMYLYSNIGTFALNSVLTNLDWYTYAFNSSHLTSIARLSMTSLGLKTGDRFIYGYAYQKPSGIIVMDNIVSITVQ